MFEKHQQYTGTNYTTLGTLLTFGCVFSPAVLFLNRPFGIRLTMLAVTCSLACMALAWINWRFYSQLTIPTMMAKLRAR